MKNKYFVLAGILALLCVSCSKSAQTNETNSEQTLRDIRYEYGLPIDSFEVKTGQVKSGATLGGLLHDLGASKMALSQLHLLSSDVFDVRSLRSGKDYLAFYRDSVLAYFVYVISPVESVVLDVRDSLHVEKQLKEITSECCYSEAIIESSLWNAMVAQGLPVQLILDLSDIYAWTIDFFGLQRGDSMRVYYEKQWVDTTCIGVGRIYAAHFYNAGVWQEAYYFDSDSLSNPPSKRVHGYFDEKGNSLRKAFLKAPLNYKRISSTFTYHRRHPIYKTVRPHTGVDYAAPMGTPVVTIGDGTVISKGYQGGGGNTIKIRHNSTYTTAYLHLSRYAKGLAVGQHVNQGDVIGYVGSTGSSTGPHLDFRVWKNGTPINPLTMEAPPVEPIPSDLMDDFNAVVDSLRHLLIH